jgi:hypothetical protein
VIKYKSENDLKDFHVVHVFIFIPTRARLLDVRERFKQRQRTANHYQKRTLCRVPETLGKALKLKVGCDVLTIFALSYFSLCPTMTVPVLNSPIQTFSFFLP